MVKQNASPTLAELRRRKSLTQRQIAESMGFTTKAISAYERGLNEPRLTPFQMIRMMELYGCETIHELAMAVAASLRQ